MLMMKQEPQPSCAPVPCTLPTVEQKTAFPNHRHGKYAGLFTRSTCAARCRCGHVCPWHYDDSSNTFVGPCGYINVIEGTQSKCECNMFSDQTTDHTTTEVKQ